MSNNLFYRWVAFKLFCIAWSSATFGKYLDLKLKRGHGKNFIWANNTFESVDNRNMSWVKQYKNLWKTEFIQERVNRAILKYVIEKRVEELFTVLHNYYCVFYWVSGITANRWNCCMNKMVFSQICADKTDYLLVVLSTFASEFDTR